MKENSSLDGFDRALIDLLQKDNSIPLREISEKINLSTASVQRRIQRLHKNGIICSDGAILDPLKLGKKLTVIVEVRADRAETPNIEDMKKAFSGPETQQCYYVTGETDFILVMVVTDMAEFERIAMRYFDKNSRVKWYKAVAVRDSVKVSLNVPMQT